MSSALRTVLFDLDGTLVDSSELILESFRHTMRVHRGDVPSDSAWLSSMGRPLLVQLREFAGDEEEARAMFRTYREHTREHHDRLIESFPAVRRTLREMWEDGVRLGIVTSKLRAEVGMALEACRLSPGWFEVVVTADDVDEPKPHPSPVLRALRAMGEEPGRTLFVGDSVHDLEAGRAAGVWTGAALWGPRSREELAEGEPDFWIGEVAAVTELLRDWNRRRRDG